jgi:hypothetical protein
MYTSSTRNERTYHKVGEGEREKGRSALIIFPVNLNSKNYRRIEGESSRIHISCPGIR